MPFGVIIALIWVLVLLVIVATRVRGRPPVPVVATPHALEWAKRYYEDDFSRDIAARFVTILADYAPVKLTSVYPKTTFVGDLKLTDLEPAEIVMAMEAEFEVEVTEAEACLLLSIEDVILYLIRKIEK